MMKSALGNLRSKAVRQVSDSYWIRKLIVTALPPLGFRCKHCGEMCTKANGYTCACDDAAIDAQGSEGGEGGDQTP